MLSASNARAPGNMKQSRAMLADLRTDVPSSHHNESKADLRQPQVSPETITLEG